MPGFGSDGDSGGNRALCRPQDGSNQNCSKKFLNSQEETVELFILSLHFSNLDFMRTIYTSSDLKKYMLRCFPKLLNSLLKP